MDQDENCNRSIEGGLKPPKARGEVVRLRFAPAHGTILAAKVRSPDENRIMNIEELRATLEARNDNLPGHAVSCDHDRATDGSVAQPALQLLEGREGVLNLCEGLRPGLRRSVDEQLRNPRVVVL
jgi:hypothetical protein